MTADLVEIIVEVDLARAQETTEKSGVGGEDGSDLDLTDAEHYQAYPGEPLVEVGDYPRR
jgi:hypothetical protein